MTSYQEPFAIRVARESDGSARIQVRGEIDLSTSPRLGETLHHELNAGNRVIVDLSQTEFIDSTGLNTLIGAVRESSSNGGALLVSQSMPAQIKRLLEITGLYKVLPLTDE
jgi:anti-sigma B factor antagonist